MIKTLAVGLIAGFAAFAATGTTPVTFHKDVEPLLQAKCQECHRSGEIAPMSFMSYSDTRPWAKAMKAAVLAKKMPPWYADSHFGKFANDMSLTQAQVDTLVNWVDGGAKEGDVKDAPKPREFYTGWAIGKPDAILTMPKAIAIPDSGVVEYTYVVLPTGFTEDKWIQAAETRATGRSAMHHVIAFIRAPGSHWMEGATAGEPFVPKRDERGQVRAEDQVPPEMLIGWAPGLQPTILNDGQAKLLKAGSDIILQLHYTPNGKATADKTSVGLIFAKEPPKERVMTVSAMNAFLKIPAGDPNYESHSQYTFKQDAKLVSLMPHMHVRGKDFEYVAVYPTGEKQVLLKVPHYDFNWQLSYVETTELAMPKGTRIECTAHHDNSVNNPYNPDPTKVVRWGDQTWEEMMIGFFDIAIDAKADPTELQRARTRGSE